MPPPPASPDADNRYCPTCGRTTAEAYCPDDGVATISWAGFSKSPSAYRVGDVVGDRYRIDKVLGRGGYGSVYAAVHTGTRQNIAVKMLDFDPREAGEVVLRRFYKEAQVTASLQHPNTVRVFDVGQDKGGPFFIAMELLAGPTLADVMKRALKARQAMPERQATELTIAVLRSLQEAHEQKLVHRDLKPANIMFAAIANDVVVKVLDFGIARTQDSSLTGSGLAPGTPVFMSPEQCRGQPVDARSDIYAAGIMLYLCCSGRLPFFARRQVDMMAMHINEVPPDPRDRTPQPLSEEVVSIIMKSLEKNPDDRYQTAAAMLTALEGCLAALPANRPGEFAPVSVAPLSDAEREPQPAPGAGQATTGDQPTTVLPRPGQTTGHQPAAPAPAAPAPAVPAVSTQDAPASSASKSPSPLLYIGGLLLAAGLGVVITLVAGRGAPSSAAATAAPTAPAGDKAAAPAVDPDVIKAELLAEMAGRDGPVVRRLEFAREAARLAPKNPAYAALVDKLAAEMAQKAKTDSAAPGPAPSVAPAAEQPAAAKPAAATTRRKARARKAPRPKPSAAPAVMD